VKRTRQIVLSYFKENVKPLICPKILNNKKPLHVNEAAKELF